MLFHLCYWRPIRIAYRSFIISTASLFHILSPRVSTEQMVREQMCVVVIANVFVSRGRCGLVLLQLLQVQPELSRPRPEALLVTAIGPMSVAPSGRFPSFQERSGGYLATSFIL